METLGDRIIFSETGEIIMHFGEMEMVGGGLSPRPPLGKLEYVDLPYGSVNHNTHRIIGIDVTTKQPILEAIEVIETEEQRRIRELEDELLLAADNELGGIL